MALIYSGNRVSANLDEASLVVPVMNLTGDLAVTGDCTVNGDLGATQVNATSTMAIAGESVLEVGTWVMRVRTVDGTIDTGRDVTFYAQRSGRMVLALCLGDLTGFAAPPGVGAVHLVCVAGIPDRFKHELSAGRTAVFGAAYSGAVPLHGWSFCGLNVENTFILYLNTQDYFPADTIDIYPSVFTYRCVA